MLSTLKQSLLDLTLTGKSLPEKLIDSNLATPETINDFLKQHFNCTIVDLASYPIQHDAIALLPEETARFYNVLPLEIKSDTLLIATIDPTDFALFKDLRFITGKNIEVALSSRTVIQQMIDITYGHKSAPSRKESTLQQNSRSPVVKMVNELLSSAIRKGASDIHFEPFENELKVRFRIDGLLQEINAIPNNRKAEVLSRIKIMATLDIAEKRRPQDGQIRIEYEGRSIDIRVSTLPTGYGEKIVLRILDKSAVSLQLSSLGMDQGKLKAFESVITRPYGMILVTGPTGSGKTTTLYAALNRLKSPTVNISTVEDPIEYHIDGINQTQVKPEISLTFSSALRTLLRQDPNIIMVGEIRDRDTADIAVRAALTGHLVLSTLHTNDAPSAIVRLQDMGIESFLITSSVMQIIAQRLVRRICENCKEEVMLAPHLQAELGIHSTVFRGKGCQACGNSGYKGRIGLYEVMTVSESIKKLIIDKKNASEIKELAVSEGMVSLRLDGILKIKAGVTTVEEVLRETVCSTS